MEQYDIVMIYEHKVRELENLCLLKYELERRGYIVGIFFLHDQTLEQAMHFILETELLVTAYCYNTESIRTHVKKAIKFNKIIDMQWEQAIYKEQEDNPNSLNNFSGIAKKVTHISWGTANYNRLINTAGIAPHNVKLVGNITMDFLRQEFRGYYKTREELFSEYNIPSENRVCLFVASFKYGFLNDVLRKEIRETFGENRLEYYETAVKTRKIVIDWITMILEKEKDITFIYRPHPGEKTDDLDGLQKKYGNFKVIGDYSIKQWIVVCDEIFTWFSTAVAEVFFAERDCAIIAPLVIPKSYEKRIQENCYRIKTYDEFRKQVLTGALEFPIKEEMIEEYYHIDRETPVYQKIVDVFEQILKDDKYKLPQKDQKECYEKKSFINWLCNRIIVHSAIYNIYRNKIIASNSKNPWIINKKKAFQLEDHFRNIYRIDEMRRNEISDIIAKIDKILYIEE